MMEQTVFILSMVDYDMSFVPKFYRVNDDNSNLSFTDARFFQEATSKAILSKHHIDYIALGVSQKVYDSFNEKKFFLKDFIPSSENTELTTIDIIKTKFKDHIRDNDADRSVVELFLLRLKAFLLNDESYLCNDSLSEVDIPMHLFNTKDKQECFSEYYINEDTRTKVNSYLSEQNEKKAYEILKMMYLQSKKEIRAVPLINNQNIVIYLYAYSSNAQDKLIELDGFRRRLLKHADKVNVYFDSCGLLKTDYHLFINIFHSSEEKDNMINILGVSDVKEEANNYILSCYDASHIPDLSYAIFYLFEYYEHGKVASLKSLKKYLNSRNLSTIFLDEYICALSYVESGISLCNVKLLKFGINALRKVYHRSPKNLDKNIQVGLNQFKDRLRQKFGSLLIDESISVYGLIKWCIENDYFQQALTLVEALSPQEMVESGIIYYAKNYEEAEKMMEKWNVLYWNEISKCRYTFNDLSHYFIKSYGRTAINNSQPRDKALDDLIHVYANAVKGQVPELGLLYSNLTNEQLFLDLLLQYYRIGNLRNEVAHALTSDNDVELALAKNQEDNTFEKVRFEIQKFLDLYGEALKQSKGDKPFVLDDKVFSEYSRTHKLVSLRYPKDGVSDNYYTVQYNGQAISINIKLRDIEDSSKESKQIDNKNDNK